MFGNQKEAMPTPIMIWVVYAPRWPAPIPHGSSWKGEGTGCFINDTCWECRGTYWRDSLFSIHITKGRAEMGGTVPSGAHKGCHARMCLLVPPFCPGLSPWPWLTRQHVRLWGLNRMTVDPIDAWTKAIHPKMLLKTKPNRWSLTNLSMPSKLLWTILLGYLDPTACCIPRPNHPKTQTLCEGYTVFLQAICRCTVLIFGAV